MPQQKKFQYSFYSTILFSAIFSIVVFKQVPDLMSVLGYVIIFAASYYMYMKNRPPKSERLKIAERK